ncbi:MAG: helix-turn-helix domain-containing protein [Elusimicrobiales bacterium]
MKNKSYASHLGYRLRYIFARLRIKPEKLAPIINVDPARIQAMMKGELTPDAEVLAKIAEHTNASPAWLLTGASPSFLQSESKEITEIIQALKKNPKLKQYILDTIKHWKE